MKALGLKLLRLFKGLLPTTAFFFLAFQLITVSRALILSEYDIQISTFAAATVGALVLAKVVVFADHLPFINRFPDKPLMVNVAWKTPIYLVATGLVEYVEAFVHAVFESGKLSGAHRLVVAEIVWPRLWLVQIWLVVLLVLYCISVELIRALGRDRILELFFGTKPNSS